MHRIFGFLLCLLLVSCQLHRKSKESSFGGSWNQGQEVSNLQAAVLTADTLIVSDKHSEDSNTQFLTVSNNISVARFTLTVTVVDLKHDFKKTFKGSKPPRSRKQFVWMSLWAFLTAIFALGLLSPGGVYALISIPVFLLSVWFTIIARKYADTKYGSRHRMLQKLIDGFLWAATVLNALTFIGLLVFAQLEIVALVLLILFLLLLLVASVFA